MGAGFSIDSITLGGTSSISLGWLGMPIAILWIVGVTNAVNLIDGLDGLAGGITLVTIAALFASAIATTRFVTSSDVPKGTSG